MVSHCDLGLHLLKILSPFKNQRSRRDHFMFSLKKSEQYVSQQVKLSSLVAIERSML